MENKKLTPQLIAALLPLQSGEYSLQDSLEPALSVRVRPSGAKSYQVRYRPKGTRGQPKRYTLGNVDSLSLAEARKEAERIKALATLSHDPAAEKAAQRKELTVSELCDLYMSEGIEMKKASTLATDKGRIERHIKPLLRKKLASSMSSSDVERFMRDVANGKTAAVIKTGLRGRAIVKGGKGTAARTVGLLGGIFTFAQRRKLRADNPVRGVKRYADRKNERFLSPLEISTLGEALRIVESEGSNVAAITIIRLLIFTGARKSEIATLKWSEVDFDRKCLRLADSKTGAKVIPLGPPSFAILETLKKKKVSPFVFPAEAGVNHFQGTEKVWKKVKMKTGFEKLRLHDLRHSFASFALSEGNTLPIIGKLLGHADIKTTSRYAHLADNPVKIAADNISNAIETALNKKQP
jgi:integrase